MEKYKDKLWLGLGVVIAIASYFIAQLVNASGVIIVGVSIGFIVALYGFYKEGKVKKEYIFPYGYCFFGAFACVFTLFLYVEGDFSGDTGRLLILLLIGLIALAFGYIQIRSLKKEAN